MRAVGRAGLSGGVRGAMAEWKGCVGMVRGAGSSGGSRGCGARCRGVACSSPAAHLLTGKQSLASGREPSETVALPRRGRHVWRRRGSSRSDMPMGRQGNTMSKAPRRYRPRKVVARSSYARSTATVPTTAPSNIALQVESRHLTSYRPESGQIAAPTLVDVRALQAGLRALAELATVRDEAWRVVVGHDDEIRSAVVHLRVDGASWGQIGVVLGISRQGARQRFDPATRAAHRSRPIHARSTDLADDVTPPAARRTPADDEQEGSRWTSWRP